MLENFRANALRRLPWSQRLSFDIIFFGNLQREVLIEAPSQDRKESLWSRSLRISLSCWLST